MTLVGVWKVMTIIGVSIVFAKLNVANYENAGEFLVFMGALGMVQMISRSSHLDCIP